MFFRENSFLFHQHKINESTCYPTSSRLLVNLVPLLTRNTNKGGGHAPLLTHNTNKGEGRPTITKYFDQRQLGVSHAPLLARNTNMGGKLTKVPII
jgi:hypothetical protein